MRSAPRTGRVAIGHLCCHDDPKAEIPIAIAKRGAFVGFDRVVSDAVVRQITVENPRRLLAFRA